MGRGRTKRDFQLLVVEDDEDVMTSLAQVLADEGYEVSVAQHGRAALSLLHAPDANSPELILLDLVTPVMDGLRFLQQQVEDVSLAAVPVLLISASSAVDKDALPPGLSVDVLQTPFALETLLSRVARLVASHRKSRRRRN